MAKNIIAAKNKKEATTGSGPRADLSETDWEIIYGDVKNFDRWPLLKKIFQYFYGNEASFVIANSELKKLAREIETLSIRHKFIDVLKGVMEEAQNKGLDLYGLAD